MAGSDERAEVTAQAEKPPEAAPGKPPEPTEAAWGKPLVRFEELWTAVESRLVVFVLLWELAALVAWVVLNGLAESVAQTAGVVFRGVIGAIALSLLGWFGAKKAPLERRRALTIVGFFSGILLAALWHSMVLSSPSGGIASLDKATAGYFDNLKGWLQEGSTLTLMGGLRGLGTRLTLWLALLGGSLATAAGRHIHIDVIYHFLPKKLRIPAVLVNSIAAATMCFSGAWGFFDHIAIESYGAKADATASSKIEQAVHHIDEHLFFTRKQLGLDLRSFPRVLIGGRYDQWLTASEWNQWVDGAGFDSHFTAAQVSGIRSSEGSPPRVPLVISPSGEATRGILVNTLGLVFPFGLLAIGLRFLLRALLCASGHFSVDPVEALKEDLNSANRTELDPDPASTEKGGA